ncbi:MAG: DNA polymerase III subunit chi [Holosporaceae bacterium]|jgi:DNA polymerase-3 subunit chi|nr:DNA polymerase III subunit chi [Holosporaceae bacterium]
MNRGKFHPEMEINFYHAAEGALISAAVKLLEKIYAAGQRCVFYSPLEERLKIVDKTLWTFSTDAFIPHGDRSLGFCEKQPIYFADCVENPNGAEALVIVDTLDYKNFKDFKKIIFIFEENSQAEAAKALCDDLKKNGENVKYWKQNPKGWEKLA